MRQFRWHGWHTIPPHLDLRLCGWALIPDDPAPDDNGAQDCVGVLNTAGITPANWLRFLTLHGRLSRRLMLLVGINDPVDRARMLRLGFGEVTGDAIALPELEARAIRLAELEETLPRYRRIASLCLDLLAREAYVDDRPLGLHPREFSLLWRLADSPGRAVSKQSLVRDVWRMGFMPDTNSVAVHVSRLRGKLGSAGLKGIVQTAPSGGYRLRSIEETARPAIPLSKDGNRLDSYTRTPNGSETIGRETHPS